MRALSDVEGIIDRRLLINFRVDPDLAARVVPAPFHPKTAHGFAIVGICLLRLTELRPHGLPRAIGITTESAAHRFAVEWDTRESTGHGVYIPRRDTSSRVSAALGGRVFPGDHHRARFRVAEAGDRYEIGMDSLDRDHFVHVRAREVRALPSGSVFADIEAASDFFRRDTVGYSQTRDATRFDGLEMEAAHWHVDPLEVEQVHSSYFADPEIFPPGSVSFDSALSMRRTRTAWHARPRRAAPRRVYLRTHWGSLGHVTKIEHPSVDERRAHGKAARERALPGCHGGWEPAPDRPDPIALLEAQNATREPDLVPVRHGRMMVSPFTFYRGGAKIMAADLKATPSAGLGAQMCGDAHLSNFGVFASPERTLLFDLNDFDETLPGPFEWDVKRLAASFTIAARNNGFTKAEARAAALRSAESYRERMAEFAQMTTMDIWYARLSEEDLMRAIDTAARALKSTDKALAKTAGKTAQRTADKARTHDSHQALAKLAELVDGRYRIISQPPLIIPVREMAAERGLSPDEVAHILREQFRAYRATLQDDRRHLLERFQLVDVARKVVGVGSVGTRSFIALLQGRDQQDPLFLQVKEATRSVLEDHLPKSKYRQPGERVVQGQRMMQAASDIYLGWTKGIDDGRFLYWRQLRDMKGSAVIEDLNANGLEFYGHICGQTLARAHARSGDPIAIASYLGKKDRFEVSIADFSVRYADQNERDYDAFCAAIRSGRLEAQEGL